MKYLIGIALFVIASITSANEPPTDANERLTDGWRKEYRASESGDKYSLWVEKGWLQISRQASDGQLDWHIVLARATDPMPPVINFSPKAGGISVSYQSGRFFVREFRDYLRCLREEKTAEMKDWPRLSVSKDDFTLEDSTGGGARTVSCWEGKSWYVVSVGPEDDAIDGIIRLNQLELAAPGYSNESNADFARVYHGKTELMDDGSLLVCRRTMQTLQTGALAHQTLRENLLNSPAPKIDGQKWINSAALPWEQLKGKVVLLDFWGMWCGPCVAKLPHTQELYQMYKDQGLIVIGIHSEDGADAIEAFLKKHQIEFPIVVDAGETAERYGVEGWPTYFLIDRQGKMIWGSYGDAPKPEKIEELLKQ